jgi:eukaryotic-like serine/threonine-protein kinase
MSYCPACQSDYPDDWKRCPKDEAALLRSRQLGKYRVDGIIGTGGMGAVYRAFNPDTQAPVAIKLMHPHASEAEAARARFRREAAAVAALRTTHAVSIYDFGSEPDGTLYLVMELLEGHSLRAEIKPPPDTMAVGRIHMVLDGALRGLGAAHRAGIIHRDLKPENIFIADTDDGEIAKVLDFGIARVDSRAQSALTQSGSLMGTPAYMAPEQIAGNRGEIGPWADVYAMGVILYEMLTGAAPFSATSVTSMLGKFLSRDFTPLGAVRAELPAPVVALCERAMADDHRSRFADADELHEAWCAAYESFPAADRTVSTGGGRRRGARARTSTPLGIEPTLPTPDGRARAGAGGGLGELATTPARPVAAGSSETSPPPDAAAGAASPPDFAASQPALPAGRASRLPLIGGAIAVAGAIVAAVVVLGGSSGGGDRPALTDAAVVAVAPPDAATAAAVPPDAAPPDDMVRFAGGAFDYGVEPGQFSGFPEAEARRAVTLAPFWIDRTEMTAGAYHAAVGGDAPSEPSLPAREVSWDEARAACAAVGKRLPTEVEWERAATSAPLDPRRARMLARGVDGPAPVGTHPGDCTPDGLCDLLGNVSEWTADPWQQGGALSPDPNLRAVRGGSFAVGPRAGLHSSPYSRAVVPACTRSRELGFRCARDAAP